MKSFEIDIISESTGPGEQGGEMETEATSLEL